MNPDLIKLIKNYPIDKQYQEILKKKTIVSISGPTSSGKDTLINQVLNDPKFVKIKTYTTRKPRQLVDNIDDTNYFFIDFEIAKNMILQKQFLEVAIVHNNIYGTTYNQFDDDFKSGHIPILNIDVQGVLKYRNICNKLISFFLLPPNFRVLLDRYFNRQTNPSDLKTRLNTSLYELEVVLKSDWFYQIVSDDLEASVQEFKSILQQKRTRREYPNLIKELITDIQKYLRYN
jgi:guanylate kinase